MITLGIDFAASPDRTACCRVDWGTAEVRLLERPLTDEQLVEHIRQADVAAIDVPLGWPAAFVEALDAHHAGTAWPVETDDRTELRYRLTDRALRELGSAPLSVSSDLIGVAAMRAARLQHRLVDAGVEVDRSGVTGSLVEVYPAAALRAWGFRSKGYKRSKNQTVLEQLVRGVLGQCGSVGVAAAAALDGCDDDDFDAFVCAVLARAARSGLTIPPTAHEMRLARTEGWIHVPTGAIGQATDTTDR